MLKRANTNLQVVKNYIIIFVLFIILSFGLIFLGELIAPTNVQWIFTLLRYIIAVTFILYINKRIFKNEISFTFPKSFVACVGWLIAITFVFYNLWGLTHSIIHLNTNTEITNFLFCVGPGIFEELWFRGVIFNRLSEINKSKKFGIIIALLLSAFLFMLSHLLVPDYSSSVMMMWQAVESFGMGILFATIYYVTRNLGLSMLMHFSRDFCTFFIFWQFSFLNNFSPAQINIGFFCACIIISAFLLIIKDINNKK